MQLNEALLRLQKVRRHATRIELLGWFFASTDFSWHGKPGEQVLVDSWEINRLVEDGLIAEGLRTVKGKATTLRGIRRQRVTAQAHLMGIKGKPMFLGRDCAISRITSNARPDWLAGAQGFLRAFEDGTLRIATSGRVNLALAWARVNDACNERKRYELTNGRGFGDLRKALSGHVSNEAGDARRYPLHQW